jgi:hypothetical protein
MIAAVPVRARKLLALTALAAALTASGAEKANSSRAEQCVGATSGRAKVGAITRILHTSVFVRNRYMSAAPCDLLDGDDVRTDSRGEAVLQLAIGGRATTCALLQRGTITVYPASGLPLSSSSRRVVSFSAGRTWCARRGTTVKSLYSAGRAELLTGAATFGVEVDRGTVLVKVAPSSATLRVQTTVATKVLLQRQAVLISPTGKITGPEPARFDAKDGLALARLR